MKKKNIIIYIIITSLILITVLVYRTDIFKKTDNSVKITYDDYIVKKGDISYTIRTDGIIDSKIKYHYIIDVQNEDDILVDLGDKVNINDIIARNNNGNILSKTNGTVVYKSYNYDTNVLELYVYDLENLVVKFSVSQNDSIYIQKGDSIDFYYINQWYSAEIDYVGLVLNESTIPTLDVSASFHNDNAIFVNSVVNINITYILNRNVLIVPKKAVKFDGKQTYVYIKIKGSNDYIKRIVEIGSQSQLDVEIVNGLNEGDIVGIEEDIYD